MNERTELGDASPSPIRPLDPRTPQGRVRISGAIFAFHHRRIPRTRVRVRSRWRFSNVRAGARTGLRIQLRPRATQDPDLGQPQFPDSDHSTQRCSGLGQVPFRSRIHHGHLWFAARPGALGWRNARHGIRWAARCACRFQLQRRHESPQAAQHPDLPQPHVGSEMGRTDRALG